jgi:hypothetical protein
LDAGAALNYKKIDKKAFEEWAYRSFDDPGWRSYFAYEDMKLLKEMSFGKPQDVYNLLIGRRIQLLYLFDEMKQAVEMKKSEEHKKNSAKQKDE